MHPVKVRAGRYLLSRAAFITSSARRSTVAKAYAARCFSSRYPAADRPSFPSSPSYTSMNASFTKPNLNPSSGAGMEKDVVRLPNHRLLARAFHRRPDGARSFSGSAVERKKDEGKAGVHEEHVLEEGDSHNVQHDASRKGKEERAKGEGGRSASEGSGGSNKKAKEEFPEAPDTIGMQDERGGKS